MPISTDKIQNQGHGSVTLRSSTSDSVKTDESLAGPWRSPNCQRIWQLSEESSRCAARSDWSIVHR